MQTWREETAVVVRMVPTDAWHDGEFFAQLICVLGIKARCGLSCHFSRGIGQTAVWIEALGIVVVVERCPHTHVVVLGKVCFEHQLGISVLLYDIILSLPERVVGIMPRAVQHQGNGCVVFGIKREAVFPLHLIAVGSDRSCVAGF